MKECFVRFANIHYYPEKLDVLLSEEYRAACQKKALQIDHSSPYRRGSKLDRGNIWMKTYKLWILFPGAWRKYRRRHCSSGYFLCGVSLLNPTVQNEWPTHCLRHAWLSLYSNLATSRQKLRLVLCLLWCMTEATFHFRGPRLF